MEERDEHGAPYATLSARATASGSRSITMR
jgi:hypothetical protein